MRAGTLVMSLIGSFLSLGMGMCSGACMGGLSKAAKDKSGEEMATSLVGMAFVTLILGLVGGIMSFSKMGKNEKPTIGRLILLVAGLSTLGNTFSFLTGGLCLLVAALLAFLYKPTESGSLTEA